MAQHAYTDTRIVDLTTNTDAYASGDMMTAAETKLDNVYNEGQGGIIQQVVIIDQAKQSKAIELLFFDREPSNTTFTINGALTIHDTDLDAVVGSIVVEETDYQAYADNSVATVKNIGFCYGLRMENKTYRDLYVVAISRGAGTYAADSLRVRLTFWYD